jgi:hypothetical protein
MLAILASALPVYKLMHGFSVLVVHLSLILNIFRLTLFMTFLHHDHLF